MVKTNEELYQKLLNSSFRFLSFRSRSKKEITDFLKRKLQKWHAHELGTLEKVIERLTELGYVDDRKFAKLWVDERRHFKPKGKALLARELGLKGISKEIIQEVLELKQEIAEVDLARMAIQKKLSLWRRLPKIDQIRKITGFLTRRGFSFSITRSIIDERLGKDYNSSDT